MLAGMYVFSIYIDFSENGEPASIKKFSRYIITLDILQKKLAVNYL